MKNLQFYLDQLCDYADQSVTLPFDRTEIFIAEDTDISHGQVTQIPRSAIYTPEKYDSRFAKHLHKGYAWINMNAAGILDGVLIVVIELPQSADPDIRGMASVNFSGPNINCWDASGHIEIIGCGTEKPDSQA